MRYSAVVTQENGAALVRFPDCPGCHTQVESDEDIEPVAREALEGWLEAHLVLGRVPPLPPAVPRRAPAGWRRIMVPVSAPLALRIQLRAARHRAGLTQAALARRVGVRQQQVAALESPDANVSLGTLLRVAEALGHDVAVELSPRLEARDRRRRRSAHRTARR